jgi:peptidoglycan/LPS O-acetylase OafA/YrhL
MILQNKRLLGIVGVVGVLLLIPLVAMQFTNEVSWSIFDFAVAAFLLLGTGLLCDLVWRKVKTTRMRIGICVAILVLLLLVWGELAVGIFGTPFAGS